VVKDITLVGVGQYPLVEHGVVDSQVLCRNHRAKLRSTALST
jgi:hypothetical protein